MTIAQDCLNREIISDSCAVIASHAKRIEQRAAETETMPDYEPSCMSQLNEAITALLRAKKLLLEKQRIIQAAE